MIGGRATVVRLIAAGSAAACVVSAGIVDAQSGTRTVWDGVYASEQAERGRIEYRSSCSECHAPDLVGAKGPALKGEAFVKNWEAESLGRLFEKIKESMPLDGPQTVTDQAKLDILAHILQSNEYPAGTSELNLAAGELERIQIVRQGATGVPNFGVVRVVGCLVPASDGKGWALSNTSEPVLTRDNATTAAALKEAASIPLGTDTFSLISVAAFEPESHRGHKVEARGLLNRIPGENLLDVLSLSDLAPTCGR